MIMTNLILIHQIILLPERMSQVQVATKKILKKNQYINMKKQWMFLIIYIRSQKHTVIGHMVVPQMLQQNTMFTMMTWHLLIRQIFNQYKIFTFIQMLSSLFWASFQDLEISFLKGKTIRPMKSHHHQNMNSKHVFRSKYLLKKIKICCHWGTWQRKDIW